MIARLLNNDVEQRLREMPAVAILGPRQCGKSTLARSVLACRPDAVMLDLERPSDQRKLADPELFFQAHRGRLLCLDEIQRVPELFPVLRSVMDEVGKNGQLLILGSASPDLLRQSSETLAGRIAYLELTPIQVAELAPTPGFDLSVLWLRGGFPRSLLAEGDAASERWREDFVRTFLERDLAQFSGMNLPPQTMLRLWTMLAHSHGQTLNLSKLGDALGLSHTSLRKYVDVLVGTFMLRSLPPTETNLKKRLIKTPKIYLRDSGILHALLEIPDYRSLLAHPAIGPSWEGFAIENIIARLPGWQASFYRTSDGSSEMDLVLERGRKRICVECKASSAPVFGAGFHHALEALAPDAAYVVAPIPDTAAYPIKSGATVCSLLHLCQELSRIAP